MSETMQLENLTVKSCNFKDPEPFSAFLRGQKELTFFCLKTEDVASYRRILEIVLRVQTLKSLRVSVVFDKDEVEGLPAMPANCVETLFFKMTNHIFEQHYVNEFLGDFLGRFPKVQEVTLDCKFNRVVSVFGVSLRFLGI